MSPKIKHYHIASYFSDEIGKMEITALRVKCDNFGRSCKWVGTVGTLDPHIATCQFTPVPCPKQCKKNDGSIQLTMRKDLQKHLKVKCSNRDYECKYCGKKDTYANITDVHDGICEKKIIRCSNGDECTETVERGDILKHLDSCDFTVISCKYRSLGCNKQLKRYIMKKHERDDNIHLHQALNTVVKLQENLAVIQGRSDTLKKSLPFIFKVPNFTTKKQDDKVLYSQSFYTSIGGYKMRVAVYPNGCNTGHNSHVSVFVYIMHGTHDTDLNWPCVGTMQIELLNHLADHNHHKKMSTFNEEKNAHFGSSLGFNEFIPHSELSCNHTQYLKDDTLYFRVTVEVDDYKPWLECTAK